MTTKSDFDEQDWTRIVRAPFVAGMAITLADPGGPIEAAKETAATLKIATNPPTREQLLTEVALDVQAMVAAAPQPAQGFQADLGPAGRRPGRRRAPRARTQLVSAKAAPEEAAAFGAWIVQVAQAAADAAKEGGFMGFGAEQVSSREKDMIDRVRAAVTTTT